jgi:polyribonucleotide nucleotidyltransferase
MDFKVAGTMDGITSLQMDIKITSITKEIMEIALNQASGGRKHIIGIMNEALPETRSKFSKHAPQIISITIAKAKIKDVIGSGGKVIKNIVEVSGAKLEVNDDGIVKIASSNEESINIAKQMVEDIVAEPEVGKVYNGKVVKIVEFGAFVNFMGARDGLLHVSQISQKRVENVSDVLSEGQEVQVKVLDVDRAGKVKLSMKEV